MQCELCGGTPAVLKVLDELDDECGVHTCWLCFKDNYLEEIVSNEKKLHIVREQLKLMDDFMSKTPTHNPLWWCDEMPAYPEEYTPEEWQAENKAIFLVWSDYLAELEHQNLNEHRALANELPVADLLAASKKESEK